MSLLVSMSSRCSVDECGDSCMKLFGSATTHPKKNMARLPKQGDGPGRRSSYQGAVCNQERPCTAFLLSNLKIESVKKVLNLREDRGDCHEAKLSDLLEALMR